MDKSWLEIHTKLAFFKLQQHCPRTTINYCIIDFTEAKQKKGRQVKYVSIFTIWIG